MWPRVVNAALGIWLMAAPAVLGYGPPASTSDRIVGPLVAGVAVVAMAGATRPLRRVNTVLGGWLIVAPWLLGFDSLPLLGSTAVGLVVTACSLVRGEVKDRFGGGWSALWRREE